MPGITISSAYGAGGSVVAPKIAERLGLTLLDRAISARVADDLRVSLDEARQGERKQSFADRFFCALAPLADTVAGDAEIARSDRAGAEEFRTEATRIMSEALDKGAVILGRGGGAAFQDRDDVLRIRFYGTPEQRLDAAMRFSGVSEDEARHHLTETDAARAKYVHHLYGRDLDDPSLYHLQFNTPLLELNQCVEMIVSAYQAFLAKRGERAAAG